MSLLRKRLRDSIDDFDDYPEPHSPLPVFQPKRARMMSSRKTLTSPSCFINRLPEEILVQIFLRSVLLHYADYDRLSPIDISTGNVSSRAEPSGSNIYPCQPFQVILSHVNGGWRDIVVNTPVLWTTVHFMNGPTYAPTKLWIDRAAGLPLDISLQSGPEDTGCFSEPEIEDSDPDDLDDDDDDDDDDPLPFRRWDRLTMRPQLPPDTKASVDNLMDIIIRHIQHTRMLRIFGGTVFMERIMERLAEVDKVGAAPQLKMLQLCCAASPSVHPQDVEMPSSGLVLQSKHSFMRAIAPNLEYLSLLGIHIPWQSSAPPALMKTLGQTPIRLRRLELNYTGGPRQPAFHIFAAVLRESAGTLESLSLASSGPRANNRDWPCPSRLSSLVYLPRLERLFLEGLAATYVDEFIRLLILPSVKNLILDLDWDEYDDFAEALMRPFSDYCEADTKEWHEMCHREGIDLSACILTQVEELSLFALDLEDQDLVDRFYAKSVNIQRLMLTFLSATLSLDWLEKLDCCVPSAEDNDGEVGQIEEKRNEYYLPRLRQLKVVSGPLDIVQEFIASRISAKIPLMDVKIYPDPSSALSNYETEMNELDERAWQAAQILADGTEINYELNDGTSEPANEGSVAMDIEMIRGLTMMEQVLVS